MRTSRSLQKLMFRSSHLETQAEQACRPSWHCFWSRKETLGQALLLMTLKFYYTDSYLVHEGLNHQRQQSGQDSSFQNTRP